MFPKLCYAERWSEKILQRKKNPRWNSFGKTTYLVEWIVNSVTLNSEKLSVKKKENLVSKP